MMQGSEPSSSEVDPMVLEAVKAVRDRFGAVGLRSLITLANDELVRAERAETRLAGLDRAEPSAGPATGNLDVADTQAWLAFTEDDPK